MNDTTMTRTAPSAGAPNRYRLMLLVWLAVWPLITVIGLASTPLLSSTPTLVRTMVTTTVMVPIMVGLLIPMINRHFGDWLRG